MSIQDCLQQACDITEGYKDEAVESASTASASEIASVDAMERAEAAATLATGVVIPTEAAYSIEAIDDMFDAVDSHQSFLLDSTIGTSTSVTKKSLKEIVDIIPKGGYAYINTTLNQDIILEETIDCGGKNFVIAARGNRIIQKLDVDDDTRCGQFITNTSMPSTIKIVGAEHIFTCDSDPTQINGLRSKMFAATQGSLHLIIDYSSTYALMPQLNLRATELVYSYPGIGNLSLSLRNVNVVRQYISNVIMRVDGTGQFSQSGCILPGTSKWTEFIKGRYVGTGSQPINLISSLDLAN